MLAVAFAALLVAALAAWSQRRPLAAHYIDRTLRAHGVQARYRMEDLGLGRQRLTDLVIGNPLRPDLVADWIEVNDRLDWSGAQVTAVRVGNVRVNARWVGSRMSLGTLDRLLPASTNQPFVLPALDADLGKVTMRLVAPAGVVMLRVSGRGRLDDGFKGRVLARSTALEGDGCRTGPASAALAVTVARGQPSLTGPVSADRIACRGAVASGVAGQLAVHLGEHLDRWRGTGSVTANSVGASAGGATGVNGTGDFVGSAAQTSGAVDLRSSAFSSPGLSGGALRIAGRYRYAVGTMGFTGSARASSARLPAPMLARIARLGSATGATPIGPLMQRLSSALAQAGRDFDLVADGAAASGSTPALSLTRAALSSRSGARASLASDRLRYDLASGAVEGRSSVTTTGGGLPDARINFAASGGGGEATASVASYAAGHARLALAPVQVSGSRRQGWQLATQAQLSGPLGTGRVDDLVLPILARWDGGSRLVLNPVCTPIAFGQLVTSGTAIGRTRLVLCPLDGAMMRVDHGVLGGGARLGRLQIAGTMSTSPLALTASSAEVRLPGSFELSGVDARLGTPDRLTHVSLAALDGALTGSGASGRFMKAAGQIASVPLLLGDANGTWQARNGQLTAAGAMTVADAGAPARFKPLLARDLALRLADGRITATATLVEPAKQVAITDVAIDHDLGRGTGEATLTVRGITFGKTFQPDELTPLTFGVIADVAGTVTGEGSIRWSPAGVNSSGVFRTAGTDLAAAIGPVTGIAGKIHFTDLLSLESARGQVATIKTINAGVAIEDGTIRYQTLPGARIRIEEGRWPFAGGTLALDPGLIDFAEARERHLTFTVNQVEAGQFLQQFNFKNLHATGLFDGRLPMTFDATGGRIEGGELTVRSGGGTLAYVGEISQKDVGFWGNFAFQALKSLRYRSLAIAMNGPLAGEMITEVRFAGVGQGTGAKRNFVLNRLQHLPLVFNVRIKAPFRQLIDTTEAFYDPQLLIARNLPALIDEQNKRSIQPPESRTKP